MAVLEDVQKLVRERYAAHEARQAAVKERVDAEVIRQLGAKLAETLAIARRDVNELHQLRQQRAVVPAVTESTEAAQNAVVPDEAASSTVEGPRRAITPIVLGSFLSCLAHSSHSSHRAALCGTLVVALTRSDGFKWENASGWLLPVLTFPNAAVQASFVGRVKRGETRLIAATEALAMGMMVSLPLENMAVEVGPWLPQGEEDECDAPYHATHEHGSTCVKSIPEILPGEIRSHCLSVTSSPKLVLNALGPSLSQMGVLRALSASCSSSARAPWARSSTGHQGQVAFMLPSLRAALALALALSLARSLSLSHTHIDTPRPLLNNQSSIDPLQERAPWSWAPLIRARVSLGRKQLPLRSSASVRTTPPAWFLRELHVAPCIMLCAPSR